MPPRGTSSSSAARVRTAWFVVLTSVEGGVVEIHLGWKYADNSVGLYSNCSKSSKSRPGWGRISDCKFKNIQDDKGDSWGHFIFNNRYEKKAFKLAEFNPPLWEMNSFTSKILEMRAGKRDETLAMYMSLLPQASSFSQNKIGVHDIDGFKLDKTGVQIEHLEEKQGSLAEYRQFVQMSVESCMNVSNLKAVMEKVEGGTKKRKNSNEEESTSVKKSRSEKVAEAKTFEVNDKEGVEKSFMGKYLGRAEIPLHNLTSSSKVKLPINSFKVAGLANKIAARPDPTLLCFTVCPLEGSHFDSSDLASNSYEVIHGRHRLLALQQLDQKGLLTKVVGMEEKLIICYIVRIDCAILANYGSLRGNDLQADSVRKPFLHELIYIMEGLRDQYSLEKIVETVTRYGKLLEFGHDDLTAVKKLGSWPVESLSKLTDVLKRFERFQTLDAKDLAKRHASVVMKGGTVPVPANLLTKLGKMDPSFFDLIGGQIISKKKSLHQAVKDFSTISTRADTLNTVLKQLPDHQSLHELNEVYPGKFSNEVLDSFSGSVNEEKVINRKGEALDEYCKRVVANEISIPKALMKEIKSFLDVDLSSFTECDTLVVNCSVLTDDQVLQLKTLKSKNKLLNLIVMLTSQEVKVELFCMLSTDFNNLKEIYFTNDKPIRKGDFCQNLRLGVVSCPIVYSPPLNSFNGSIENLENVVMQTSPPGGTAIFINEGRLPITGIHKHIRCQYYGEKCALEKFDKTLEAVKKRSSVFDEEEQHLYFQETASADDNEVQNNDQEIEDTEVPSNNNNVIKLSPKRKPKADDITKDIEKNCVVSEEDLKVQKDPIQDKANTVKMSAPIVNKTSKTREGLE